MPRLSEEELRRKDHIQRMVITQRPHTVVGGFWPALIPLLAAAGIPLAESAGKWVGKHVFGQGIMQAGAHGHGAGILRSGEKMIPNPFAKGPTSGLNLAGAGRHMHGGNTHHAGRGHFRMGDSMMPATIPISYNNGRPTQHVGGGHIHGGMLDVMQRLPGVSDKVKNIARIVGGKSKKTRRGK